MVALCEARGVLSGAVSDLVVDVHFSDSSVRATTLGVVARCTDRWFTALMDRRRA